MRSDRAGNREADSALAALARSPWYLPCVCFPWDEPSVSVLGCWLCLEWVSSRCPGSEVHLPGSFWREGWPVTWLMVTSWGRKHLFFQQGECSSGCCWWQRPIRWWKNSQREGKQFLFTQVGNFEEYPWGDKEDKWSLSLTAWDASWGDFSFLIWGVWSVWITASRVLAKYGQHTDWTKPVELFWSHRGFEKTKVPESKGVRGHRLWIQA